MPNANSSIIVTGATGSMGRAAVKALAARGEKVIALCRDADRARTMIDSIASEIPSADITPAIVDLSDIGSVKAFAASLEGTPVKALFNNAGTLLRNYRLSKDGLEMCVAVNFLAPFVLCEKIAPILEEGGHIVNMVSLTARFPSLDRNFFCQGPESYSQLGTYAASKLALLEYSIELARRFTGLRVNVSDPGIVNSNMIRMDRWFDPLADILFRPFCKSPEKGVAPALRALEATCSEKLFIGAKTRDIPSRYYRYGDVGFLVGQARKIAGI